MPIQAPSWTDFLNCPICCNEFAASQRVPISLGCGHTICKLCLSTLYNRQCPFDQTLIVTDIDNLPINYALLQLVGSGNASGGGGSVAGKAVAAKDSEFADLAPSVQKLQPEQLKCYKLGKKCIEDLALHLKSFLNLNSSNLLTRPMQRKLVTLVNCQLMEEEGRVRALRAARSLGERTVTELILQHQNPQQLSSNLWAAVRTRGCQFLGPAMQEEVLKLVLLALEEGSALSRKVLVMFVVQRLEPHFPQASKTSIGHVVQLLYRASCFKVSKREADSSLMQLKEEFRTYDALRREHDAQIVQIATEAGLRIAPEQWSSLLYGDIAHKSHMQSIIDKLQTPSSFAQSVQELVIALQRTSDPAKLSQLHNHLQYLASIDPCVETAPWEDVSKALDAVRHAVMGLVHFLQHHGVRKPQDSSLASGSTNSNNTKYKISLCRDLNVRRVCPRGASCTFAHSQEEVERYRARNRGKHIKSPMPMVMPNMAPNNGKKPLPMANEVQQQPSQPPPHAGPMMPISPIRYMQAAAAPPPPHRGYLEPLPPVAHNLSPSGVHAQLMHAHHSPIARQQQQQQQHANALNGLLVAPPGRYEPRFNFGPAPPQPRNAAREYAGNVGGAAGVPQRNPPNYNNSSNSSSQLHNHAKSFCSMLPTDVYHSSFFGNTNTNTNNSNNNESTANSKGNSAELLVTQLGPANPWEHTYMQQQLGTLTPTSSKNPSRPVMSTILPATADTSFYEKKPPSNINIDLELVGKQLGENAATNPDAMPLFRSNNTSNSSNSGNSSNNNNNNTSSNINNTNITSSNNNNNNSSLIFWSTHNKDSANFVRSDSILDDDASPYEPIPSGSSMHSRYGPICPKRSIARLVDGEWNNWLMENDAKIGDNATAFNDRLKSEHNDNVNPNANKNSAGRDSVFIWNDLNANATSPSINYWSNNSDADAAGGTPSATVTLSSHNERLKHHQILDRKPQLLSEDSFEGGIDSGMMSELEKNLVNIVEVCSNPDDSGITLD
ncbi:hypothetical protein KR093_010201 [Drosophila rubida]|uniref:RING-type E3 ubiquitin transferase n=1 Tax=Drosophila rubida TaxID=30044 RepID=A0AAD4PIY2_9MUSC|nr:hypothetical protein KR093_010201 [Drosophila rubida]